MAFCASVLSFASFAHAFAVERFDESLVDRAFDLADFGSQLARIVTQAFGSLAVAFGVMLERFAILPPIMERPRQREITTRELKNGWDSHVGALLHACSRRPDWSRQRDTPPSAQHSCGLH